MVQPGRTKTHDVHSNRVPTTSDVGEGSVCGPGSTTYDPVRSVDTTLRVNTLPRPVGCSRPYGLSVSQCSTSVVVSSVRTPTPAPALLRVKGTSGNPLYVPCVPLLTLHSKVVPVPIGTYPGKELQRDIPQGTRDSGVGNRRLGRTRYCQVTGPVIP